MAIPAGWTGPRVTFGSGGSPERVRTMCWASVALVSDEAKREGRTVMNRIPALVVFALALVTAALPPAAAARTEVGHNRQHSVGAQAAFDTRAVDANGNPFPGTYLSVWVSASIDSYLIQGELIESRALVASVTRYRIDEELNEMLIDSLEGWTEEADIQVAASQKWASGSGTLLLHECGWDENGPYCNEVGDAELSVTFTGTNPMAMEPMHYTEVAPGPAGYVYTTHRAASLRYASATAELDGVDLGTSLNGNLFSTHEGEVFVTRLHR